MVSLETARKLKTAGLVWKPALLDCFAVPDRTMDDQVFVLSDVLVTMEKLHGMPVVAFQGASEWALDALVVSEAVWLPREDQLRHTLESALLGGGRPEIRLSGSLSGYRLECTYAGQALSFEAGDPSEAYAAALLHLFELAGRSPGIAGGN